METEILFLIKNYIKETKNLDLDVKLESLLIDDLNLDSLDMVEIGYSLETKYSLNISEDFLFENKFKSIKDIIDYFNKNYVR